VTAMSKATREDAILFLKIMAIANADEDYKRATRWFIDELNVKNYDEFKVKYPTGSYGYKNFQSFATYGELIGTLVNKELLSEDLIFDLYGNMFWDKVEPIAHGMRKDLGMARLYENYEVCARKYPAWAENNPPKI
jgi:hypothetical protein